MMRGDDRNRNAKIVAAVACPVCGAPKDSPCRQHGEHADRPLRSGTHSERRNAWRMIRDGEIKDTK